MNALYVHAPLTLSLVLCLNSMMHAGSNDLLLERNAACNQSKANSTLNSIAPDYPVTGKKTKLPIKKETPNTTQAAQKLSALFLVQALTAATDSDFRLATNPDTNDARSIGFLPLAEMVRFNPRQHAHIVALHLSQSPTKKSSNAHKAAQPKHKARTDRSRYGASRTNNHATRNH